MHWKYKDVNCRNVRDILVGYNSGMGMLRLDLLFCYRAAVNKGIGVENIHFLCDGLWEMKDPRR